MSDDASSPGVARLRHRLAIQAILPGVDDQLDWANACVDAGLPHCGRALFETIFVREGLSPQLMRCWRAIAADHGLWEGFPEIPASCAPRSGTVEIGLAELADFATLAAPFVMQASGLTVSALPGAVSHTVRGDNAQGPNARDAFESAGELFRLLAGLPPADWSDADRLLASIVARTDAIAPIDEATLFAADLETIASALVIANLQVFVAATRHLSEAPGGSAAMLWRAARFDSAGLGPYFGNVGRLARKSKDIRELANRAADAAGATGLAGTDLSWWLFLLSDRLPRAQLFEVIDDIGDEADTVTLSLICQREAARGQWLDVDLVARIRDAALDSKDLTLATRAQTLIVDSGPASATELEVLGSIYGTVGDMAAAEQAITACLKLDPVNKRAAERIVALRKRAFAPFRVESGYETPEDRKLNRARKQRAGAPRNTGSGPDPTMVQFR